MNNISFGQYYPTNSPIHRLDPRLKLLITLGYIVLIFFINSFTSYLFCALFILTIALVGRIPLKTLLKSVKAVIFLVFFITVINVLFYKGNHLLWSWWKINIYLDGILYAIKMALRLILLVMGPALLTFTTTPMELTDGVESLLSPLKVIKFPVHDVAIIMSIALRMIPTLMEETNKITMAQKARGADLDSGNVFKRAKALIPILVPLFVGAFRRADELALAMDARCYNATPNRTKYKLLHFGWGDLFAFLIFGIYLALVIMNIHLFDLDALIWGLFA